VVVLNESVPDSGKRVFKEVEDALSNTHTVESSCDGELLFHIPFTSEVHVKAVTIRGSQGQPRAPSRMRLWVNRDDIDFTTVNEIQPAQERFIPYDEACELKIPTNPQAKFQRVKTLTILLDRPFDEEEQLAIGYIGLWGQATQFKRGAVNAVYEAWANPADHPKEEAKTGQSSNVL